MGLFRGKMKSSADKVAAAEQHFFDENFREELRNHGRWYFEKVINENGALFKQDLDATITQVNNELKEHITNQLDGAIAQVSSELKEHLVEQLKAQVAENSKEMEDAQDAALQSLTQSAQSLQEQYQQLATTLQKNVTDQEAMLIGVFEENKTQITKMRDTQGLALQWLAQSVKALQEQHLQLATALQKNVTEQEAMLVGVFEQNMAQIIEHYLLNALGDQYDLKAQLPAIIKQMETNKQAIVDDMKL
jgi:hypothetical protein